MKLAVATICPHVFYDNRWWSYEPFVLEMDIWSDLFDELIMVAPLDEGPPPTFWAPYKRTEAISVIPFRSNRGKGLKQAKTSVLEIPKMISSVVSATRKADAFHLRSPGNIGLISSLVVPLFTGRMCAKYAGQWSHYSGEPFSYRLQRAILRSKWWRGPVTVYGQWPNQPSHIVPFFTSVISDGQMELARKAAREKQFGSILRVLFVGRLSKAKNVHVLMQAIAKLKEEGTTLGLNIVGDGPEHEALEAQASALGISSRVNFSGALEFDQVLEQYKQADVLVLASETEGWPKAIAEGMAFGLVCVGSNRGLVPWMLGEGRGYLVEPGNVGSLAKVLRKIASSPDESKKMSSMAAAWAQKYTLEGLRDAIRQLLSKSWSIPQALFKKETTGQAPE